MKDKSSEIRGIIILLYPLPAVRFVSPRLVFVIATSNRPDMLEALLFVVEKRQNIDTFLVN